MTQDEALQSLITFAPDWHHAIEYRLAYVDGAIQRRYSAFSSYKLGPHEVFYGTDLEELLSSIKNFIYITRIEQTLTESSLTLCP